MRTTAPRAFEAAYAHQTFELRERVIRMLKCTRNCVPILLGFAVVQLAFDLCTDVCRPSPPRSEIPDKLWRYVTRLRWWLGNQVRHMPELRHHRTGTRWWRAIRFGWRSCRGDFRRRWSTFFWAVLQVHTHRSMRDQLYRGVSVHTYICSRLYRQVYEHASMRSTHIYVSGCPFNLTGFVLIRKYVTDTPCEARVNLMNELGEKDVILVNDVALETGVPFDDAIKCCPIATDSTNVCKSIRKTFPEMVVYDWMISDAKTMTLMKKLLSELDKKFKLNLTKQTWDDLYKRVSDNQDRLAVCNLVMKHLWRKKTPVPALNAISDKEWEKLMPNWWLPSDWKAATWIKNVANEIESEARKEGLMNDEWHRHLQWFTKLASNKYVTHSTNDIVNLLAFANEPNLDEPVFGNRSGKPETDINSAEQRLKPAIRRVRNMLKCIKVDDSGEIQLLHTYKGTKLMHVDTMYMDGELDDWYAKMINDVIARINGVRQPTMVDVTMTHNLSSITTLTVPAVVDEELRSYDRSGHWNERLKVTPRIKYELPVLTQKVWNIGARTIRVKKLLELLIRSILDRKEIHLSGGVTVEALREAHGIRQMFSLANMLDDSGGLKGIKDAEGTPTDVHDVTNQTVTLNKLVKYVTQEKLNNLNRDRLQSVHAFLFCFITLSNAQLAPLPRLDTEWYQKCVKFLPRFSGTSISSGIRPLIDVRFKRDKPKLVCRMISFNQEKAEFVFVRVPCMSSTCTHNKLISEIWNVLPTSTPSMLFITFLWKETNGQRPYILAYYPNPNPNPNPNPKPAIHVYASTRYMEDAFDAFTEYKQNTINILFLKLDVWQRASESERKTLTGQLRQFDVECVAPQDAVITLPDKEIEHDRFCLPPGSVRDTSLTEFAQRRKRRNVVVFSSLEWLLDQLSRVDKNNPTHGYFQLMQTPRRTWEVRLPSSYSEGFVKMAVSFQL